MKKYPNCNGCGALCYSEMLVIGYCVACISTVLKGDLKKKVKEALEAEEKEEICENSK